MSKYKVGDKFVIEIDKVLENKELPFGDESPLFKVKGFKSLVFDENGLDMLDKLDSDYINDNFGELQDEAYEAGLRDAWELAITIEHGLIKSELKEIFGMDNELYIVNEYTPQEAKAKIEAWEKSKEEITVGEVVEVNLSDTNFYGMYLGEDRNFWWLFTNDSVPQRISKRDTVLIEKTGRHIDIQSVLEKIGDKE